MPRLLGLLGVLAFVVASAALAQRIVATTQSLYGSANANAARAVFRGLGILP